MDKKTEALNLALEALENAQANVGNWWPDEIAAIREALAEQPAIKQDLTPEHPAQQEEMTEKELSNGLAMALHDAVLIRVGGNDEATRQACARIDKLVDKYRAKGDA